MCAHLPAFLSEQTTLKPFRFIHFLAPHSYLGYGLMAARAKVIEAGAGADKGHPCFSKGTQLKYEYGGKEYPVGEVEEHGDFKGCAATAFKALEHEKDCGQPKVRRWAAYSIVCGAWACVGGCQVGTCG